MEAKIVILEKFVNQFWRLLENNIESIDGDVFSAGATIYMNDIVEDEITEERILRRFELIRDSYSGLSKNRKNTSKRSFKGISFNSRNNQKG